MRLKRFTSSSVHGYANHDVKFNDRLTFLTGINGSGKTTILNCILALITPDLNFLQNLTYNYLRLDVVDDDGKDGWIMAQRIDEAEVRISVANSEKYFPYTPFTADPSLSFARQHDAEIEHFREISVASADHPVMRFISSLPTPMFLGLDRRARLAPEDRRFPNALRSRIGSTRPAFRGSLAASVNEASDLAQSAYREARFAAGRIGEVLQQQLILGLLTATSGERDLISTPTVEDKENLSRLENDLDEFPSIFRLPKAEVSKRVKPFISTLQRSLKNIPSDADVNEYFTKNNKAPPYLEDLIYWSSNKNQLKRISVISELVAEFNQQQVVAMEPIKHYKELLNKFLCDSGKRIDFNDFGEVLVYRNGDVDSNSLSSLSSGEAQIFVMLTNLAFNPSAQRANIFIIDEPELSLHLRWQELFVDSMMSANKQTQFVMATHSPSIILERTRNCVDVVTRKTAVKHG